MWFKDLKEKKKSSQVIVLGCVVSPVGGWRGCGVWINVLWCFPGWGSLCLGSGWWSSILSLWRAVPCLVQGLGVSVGSGCLWAVLLAGAVLDTSISAAASKRPPQHSLLPPAPPCPRIFWCFSPLAPLCTAGWSLLRRGSCGSFLSSLALSSVNTKLCGVALLCVLVSAHPAHSLCHGVFVFFFQFLGPGLCVLGFVATEVCVPCLSWPPRLTLCAVSFLRPSVGPQAYHLAGAIVREIFMGWESATFSVSCPDVPSFLRFHSSPLSLPVREPPSAWKLPLLHDSLPTSGHKIPSSSPSRPFFCLRPLSYLLPGSLACFPLLSPRGCFVGVDPYLDEFLVCLWGEWWSPCLIPLPSSSQSPLLALILSSNHVRSLEVVFNLFFEQPADVTLFWLLKFSPIRLSSGHLLGAQNWVTCYRRDRRSLF